MWEIMRLGATGLIPWAAKNDCYNLRKNDCSGGERL